jgi:hypothetical protein
MSTTHAEVLSQSALIGIGKDIERLDVLSSEVNQISQDMKLGDESNKLSLPALRREVLKAHNLSVELENERETAMGLDFVSPDEAKDIMEVAAARQFIAEPFLRSYNLEVVANRIAKVARSTLTGPALDACNQLQSEVSDLRKRFHANFWSLPDLGMTAQQWENLDDSMRKKLRPAGRPGMPLECRVLQNNAEMASLMDSIKKMSNGTIQSVEQAIEGAALSNRGRPTVSPLVKLDRRLSNLRKELNEVLASSDEVVVREKGVPGRLPATRQERVEKILTRIHDLEVEITQAEAGLSGVEWERRKLERLRAKHRDMALMEADAKGREQIGILMEILKNEQDQLQVIKAIHELDDEAKETPTHQVNPKATRDRILRLRMSNSLTEAQLAIIDQFEEEMRTAKVVRAR